MHGLPQVLILSAGNAPVFNQRIHRDNRGNFITLPPSPLLPRHFPAVTRIYHEIQEFINTQRDERDCVVSRVNVQNENSTSTPDEQPAVINGNAESFHFAMV